MRNPDPLSPKATPDAAETTVLSRRRLLAAASLATLGTAQPAMAARSLLPDARPVPGGVALLDLGPAPARPRARLGDVPVLVLGDPVGWIAVLGIALATKPGVLELTVDGAERTGRPHRVSVEPVQYAVQSLRVPQRQVELSKADLARHERERAHLATVTATRSERVPGALRMQPPVPGPRSSSFGLRRVFNGQARSPHSGMDIAAPTGTPIVAPLAGRVIDAGDYFFSGRCVWLDHGSGVLSLYAHLDRIGVETGRELEAGESLGTVGATGRVTGPHLHWSVMLNRAYVDPALFLAA